jgi:hypothetical protein
VLGTLCVYKIHITELSVGLTKGSNARMINDRSLFQGHIPGFTWIMEDDGKNFPKTLAVPAEDLRLIQSTVR